MFNLFDAGYFPIGIDAGTSAVRMVQFRRQGQSSELSLQAACRVELESLETTATNAARVGVAIQRAFSSADFSGKKIVLSLPANCVHARSVRLPQMPDSDLNQALQWEAKDRFGFECGGGANATAGQGQLVWFRAGEVRRGTEVKDEILLFAVEGGVLGEYIQVFSGLGLQIEALDLAPCANFRSARRAIAAGAATDLSAMLDLGHTGSQFLITRGDEMIFFKHIDIGGKKINEAIGAKLGISPAEAMQMRAGLSPDPSADDSAPLHKALRDAMRAPLEELARELDMCMRYFVVTFRGTRPERVTLVGRQADSADVRDMLAAALGLTVEAAQPLRGVQNLRDLARPDRSAEWAVAAGLSIYPLGAQAALEVAA